MWNKWRYPDSSLTGNFCLCSTPSPFFKGKYKFYTRICRGSTQGLILFLFIPLSFPILSPLPYPSPSPLSNPCLAVTLNAAEEGGGSLGDAAKTWWWETAKLLQRPIQKLQLPFYREPVWSPVKKGDTKEQRKSVSEGSTNCMAVRRYFLILSEKKGPFKMTELSYKQKQNWELTFGVHMKNGLFVINFASSCTAPGVSTLFFAAQFFVWFWLLSALPREKILDSSKKPGFEIRSVTLLRCGGSLSLTSLSIRWAFAN